MNLFVENVKASTLAIPIHVKSLPSFFMPIFWFFFLSFFFPSFPRRFSPLSSAILVPLYSSISNPFLFPSILFWPFYLSSSLRSFALPLLQHHLYTPPYPFPFLPFFVLFCYLLYIFKILSLYSHLVPSPSSLPPISCHSTFYFFFPSTSSPCLGSSSNSSRSKQEQKEGWRCVRASVPPS